MIGTHDPPTAAARLARLSPAASYLNLLSQHATAGVAYMGGLAILAGEAAAAAWRMGARSRTLRSAVMTELGWMIGMGLPLVALVNVGMGSFLSMQSYFGGTFADGTGAIVGVGLVRNLGPLMAGLVLGGLFAARITPELRAVRSDAHGTRRERAGFLVRTAAGQATTGAAEPPTAQDGLLAARLLAGAVTGLVMSVWASAVGTLVGWQIGQRIIGVSTHSFFSMFFDLLWVRDVVGLAIKGPLFGFLCVLFACHEGLWRIEATPEDDIAGISWATCRAACFSALAVLVIGSGWFIVFYHAGTAFGPTLLTPPTS